MDKNTQDSSEMKQSGDFIAKVQRAFTEHPHMTGETYFQHLCFTVKMAARFVYLAAIILIHGLFPFLFVRTGSRHLENIYQNLKTRAAQAKPLGCDASISHGENI